MKTVIVINGSGGVGKDTLCGFAEKQYKVRNVSSITPIKELARMCGWQGEKTDRARKFLADLKQLTVAYNDYPTVWLSGEYDRFLKSDEELMFVHIREPQEIEKFVHATGGVAKTLLIRGGSRMAKKAGNYGNSADDDVENYHYDFYFQNDLPLDRVEPIFMAALREMIDPAAKK